MHHPGSKLHRRDLRTNAHAHTHVYTLLCIIYIYIYIYIYCRERVFAGYWAVLTTPSGENYRGKQKTEKRRLRKLSGITFSCTLTPVCTENACKSKDTIKTMEDKTIFTGMTNYYKNVNNHNDICDLSSYEYH